MKLLHRVGYFSVGLIIGIVLLFFFLGGKRASCDYSPNARTLKNIKIKERLFSEKTLQNLTRHQLDTSAISNLLQKGSVLFSESNTKLDSCKIHVIEGLVSEKKIKITVENCENKATIQNAIIE